MIIMMMPLVSFTTKSSMSLLVKKKTKTRQKRLLKSLFLLKNSGFLYLCNLD